MVGPDDAPSARMTSWLDSTAATVRSASPLGHRARFLPLLDDHGDIHPSMLSAIHPITDASGLALTPGGPLAWLLPPAIDHGTLRPGLLAAVRPAEPAITASNSGGLALATRLAGILGAFLLALGEAAIIAFRMAWDTWWALVLGFTITGAVQEFISEDRLTDYLGDDGWREIGYGTLFGASSSSCSFSAVAMTRTLFTRGASAPASLGAFQFASTDLVLELALVVTVLLGWQFAAAEIVGGLVAVVVVGIVYRRFVPEAWIERARANARALEETECATCGMAADPADEETLEEEFDGERRYFCCGGCRSAYDPETEREAVTAGPELLAADRWRSATANAVKEWDMLWRDIVFGFVIAGLLAVFVPTAWWTALFGVGAEGSLARAVSNAVLGAVVGVLTFLCSVGNVPFAVVLWGNGVSFGGVLAFIFADLLILPLVRTYRRYYGTRMAAVISGAFFLAAVTAGVVVEFVFGGLGLVPPPGTAGGTISGTFTAVFNVVAVPVLAIQVYVALESHQRARIGNRLAPHVAGILIRSEQFLERIAYALEDRGLK
ncbi:permease (plasmid) [Natrinema zhouii]|uniref:permease n=1 Tax=Natrinema zhouii TaxID=1710539 RepID=UPI001CFF863E|nr:permease [Natrinema zhouii]UHQ98636.1 permease [Natrinema zhouii]